MKKTQTDKRQQAPDDVRPEYRFDYGKSKPNRFAERQATSARFIGAAVMCFVLAASASAQGRAQRGAPPRFEDYPVREVYKGPVADVRLDSSRARMFRTRLREDSRTGPNFAGRYAVVVWGCGTGCAQMGVVDAKTGGVYFPPVEYMDIPDLEDEAVRSQWFRLDSRLLRITKSFYDGTGSYTAYYYLFDRGRFRLLRKSVERTPEQPDDAEEN